MIYSILALRRPGQHRGEADALVDAVGAADGGVVELLGDLDPVALGVLGDCMPLANGAVLVAADVGSRRGSEVCGSLFHDVRNGHDRPTFSARTV